VEAPLPQPLSKYEPPIESKSNKDFFTTPPHNRIVSVQKAQFFDTARSFWPTTKGGKFRKKLACRVFLFASLDGEGVKVMITSPQISKLRSQAVFMITHSQHEVTGLLQAWARGDEEALQKLVPLVHRELRQAARRYMAGERPGHLLQTTALVNETYLRLVGVQKVSWQNRAHFLAICAQLMRRVLTDFARSRGYQKRSGKVNRVPLTDALWVAPQSDNDLAALDEAMKRLAAVDERKSRVVEMRFFGGLTVQESAEVLKISQDTVMRDWKMAKVWLLRELNGEGNRGA